MSPQDAYLESKVLAAEPLELVCLLYSEAGVAIRRAQEHLAGGHIAARSREITRALAILWQLSSSLDHARGEPHAHNLARLYDYMQRRLLEANLRQQAAPLAEVEKLLALFWMAGNRSAAPGELASLRHSPIDGTARGIDRLWQVSCGRGTRRRGVCIRELEFLSLPQRHGDYRPRIYFGRAERLDTICALSPKPPLLARAWANCSSANPAAVALPVSSPLPIQPPSSPRASLRSCAIIRASNCWAAAGRVLGTRARDGPAIIPVASPKITGALIRSPPVRLRARRPRAGFAG